MRNVVGQRVRTLEGQTDLLGEELAGDDVLLAGPRDDGARSHTHLSTGSMRRREC